VDALLTGKHIPRSSRRGRNSALFAPPRSSPRSIALRPRVVVRAPMSGASWPTEAAERGRETLIQSLGQRGPATKPVMDTRREASCGARHVLKILDHCLDVFLRSESKLGILVPARILPAFAMNRLRFHWLEVDAIQVVSPESACFTSAIGLSFHIRRWLSIVANERGFILSM
jgi:hypothetical protein